MAPPASPLVPDLYSSLNHPSVRNLETPIPGSIMRGFPVQFPARSSFVAKILCGEVSRDLAVTLLRRAFPKSRSNRARAIAAAPYLDLSPRQIQDVLNRDADLKAKHLLVLLGLVFGETLLDCIFGPEIKPMRHADALPVPEVPDGPSAFSQARGRAGRPAREALEAQAVSMNSAAEVPPPNPRSPGRIAAEPGRPLSDGAPRLIPDQRMLNARRAK